MSTTANPTTSNGITQPILKAHEGSPQMAAHQQNVAASTKLNDLNKIVKGGKKGRRQSRRRASKGRASKGRASIGGAAIEVNTITPKYTSTSSGNQDPVAQQTSHARISNQTYVQSQGDKVSSLAVPKGGSKRRTRTRKSRKTIRTKKRKTRKSNKR